MRQADGARSFVDMLPAGAARSRRLHLDVFGADVDLDVFGLGHDGDGGSRGVDATLLFGLGDSLHAVPATFVAESAIGVLAGDTEGDFLVAAMLGDVEVDELDLPVLGLGKSAIHFEEIASEEGGFFATVPARISMIRLS